MITPSAARKLSILPPLWKESERPLLDAELENYMATLAPHFRRCLKALALPAALSNELPRLYLPLAAWLAQQSRARKPLVVGINGAQGSGKSTLCTLLADLLEQGFARRCCVLSLDDLYLTREQRQNLAVQKHPLLATRGVPGTHDVQLGLTLFEQLRTAGEGVKTRLPRFDKASDDRAGEITWPEFTGCPDLILFEGWCVGALAQPETALAAPINALEKGEDQDAVWRCYVNRQLSADYVSLFAQLDLLLMLKAPAWEMVYRWRAQQEERLAARRSGCGVMAEEELRRFVMHYERLTRYQLAEMPARADLVLELNRFRQVYRIVKKAATP